MFPKLAKWDDVQKLLAQEIKGIKEIEIVPVFSSLNRVSSSEVNSPVNIPEFNRSLVDGYAISEKSSKSEKLWKIVGESKIGVQQEIMSLYPSQAIYVPTGGILPDGCISVIKIENSKIIKKGYGEFLEIDKIPEIGTHVEYTGSDVQISEVLIQVGDVVNPQKVSLLSACGIKDIEVYKQPRFSIIVTGQEVIPPGEKLKRGEVFDSTSALLVSLVASYGGKIVELHRTSELKEEIVSKIKSSLLTSDFILTTGGTSVGKADNVVKAVEDLGDVIFHGINIRPGKPVLFGKINKKPIICFPGFVTSTAIIASLFFPIIFKSIFNLTKVNKVTIKCKVSKNIKAFKNWNRIVPGYVNDNFFYPTFKTSSAITSYSDSEGYIILNPNDSDISENDEVEFTYYNTRIK